MSPADAAAIMSAAYQHQRSWRTDEIAATLASPGVRLFSAGSAMLIARILGDEAEILALATAPDQQRSGAASALIAEFHATARESGAHHAFLEVAALNAPARALYAAHGYAETGRRPRYYRLEDGRFDDAIVMQRALGEK
ncbi:ribosomal-protein-alanine N-acetyltransferase [Roseivivax sp. THAF40]|uniref:GNAT family N-acetyltransferase n=1 Tax=unclassified Roseivivax TaxID=2639302 RepID=UPI001268300D|nr:MULTISPECIES: GNAT family N-acetyltransferase [unclassified Roseivivax]QFS81876.1 ribosomal-protein-alanine N-acetyltransferase [Roseivivax sp. THAF197b]QFT45676.1 ribosomal-protein-alanine N-acetyltransferase [Roseivivax sp. THAF40]